MNVTILSLLNEANNNLNDGTVLGITIAKDQFHNAIELLNKGYDAEQDIRHLLNRHSDMNNAPEKSYDDVF